MITLTPEQIATLRAAIDHHGLVHQLLKASEEAGELVRAIARLLTETGPPLQVAEEVADVLIMALQLRLILNPDVVDPIIDYKLHRLASSLAGQPPRADLVAAFADEE